VSLAPFYRTHRRMYSVYFDVLTPAEFTARSTAIAAERERRRKIEAATVAFVQPGDANAEKQFNYQSDPPNRQVQRAGGRGSRAGTGWFSCDLTVDATAEMALLVTYFNELGQPPADGAFEILVDGTSVGRFQPNQNATGFFDTQYSLPPALTRGKSKITVKFQADANGRIAPIYGVRTVRAVELR